jgi:hypothetical protein
MTTELPYEVAAFIVTADQAGIDLVTDAVAIRRKFVDGRPKYLVGVVGTIREKRQTKVVVVLDETVGKFPAGGGIVTPCSLVEKVEVSA